MCVCACALSIDPTNLFNMSRGHKEAEQVAFQGKAGRVVLVEVSRRTIQETSGNFSGVRISRCPGQDYGEDSGFSTESQTRVKDAWN